MPTYTHGGDVWDHPGVLDFSANLHPLGMPQAVSDAAREAVSQAVHYPDPTCRALREAIAACCHLSPAQVICGAGAADLITRLCLALRPKTALVTAPTFSEYEHALSAVGCAVRSFPLRAENGFDLDESLLAHITPELDIVFLCTPNNPTGRCIPLPLVEAILRRCEACGVRLVLDECFMALTDRPDAAGLVAGHPLFFSLRAFTKTYAIPGLRLGYGLCADGALLEGLYAAVQPWAVSCVAQAAGIAACGCPHWPEEGRALLRTERPRLLAALRSLGLTVYEGEANYLLFRAAGREDLREKLLGRGILIRACGNYPGLSPDYYRVCVKTREANDLLLTRLKEVLRHG